MTSITCPRCGRTVATRGVSHSGNAEGQWECPCGCTVDGPAVYGCRFADGPDDIYGGDPHGGDAEPDDDPPY